MTEEITKTDDGEKKLPFNLGRKHLYATGRRKTAVARVRLYKGEGQIYINRDKLSDYFPVASMQKTATESLKATELLKNFDISVLVRGGGKVSQAEATRLGITRGLVKFNEDLKSQLKKAGYLRRDPRKKERKKPGLKKARKAAQFSKR